MRVKAIQNYRRFGGIALVLGAAAATIATFIVTGPAGAYIGDSFLKVPEVAGESKGTIRAGWVRLTASYWKGDAAFRRARGACGRQQPNCFSGPPGPREGAGSLMISVDKKNPALPHLMDRCLKNTPIPEMTFAESADRVRGPFEAGPRPAIVPEYFEYVLKDVRLSGCPVVAEAPEQAFIVNFGNVQWANYKGNPEGEKTVLQPAVLGTARSSSATKTFVLTWFGYAHDVGKDQCPAMNAKPTVEEYLASLSPEAAAEARAKLQSSGGAGENSNALELLTANRGPNELNVCLMPGVVPDSGHAGPRPGLAHGLNLDGDDGKGSAGGGSCQHANFTSPDGRTGIDNQLYSVMGCTTGFLGRKGLFNEFMNAQNSDGPVSILIQINGIDDERNDNSVDVTILYSENRVVKNSSGKAILADYTYRISENPQHSSRFTRLPGRIVNGVIVTEPVKSFRLKVGVFPEWKVAQARMRLEIKPDGTLKGLLGGYLDWRAVMKPEFDERSFDYKCPGMYNALKRAADGLKDPATGQCTGISAAFDIDGVPAFTSKPRTMPRITRADAVKNGTR